MITYPIKVFDDSAFNFVYSNIYDIHVGMVYSDSLFIDLDQYNKIFMLNNISPLSLFNIESSEKILPFSKITSSLGLIRNFFLDFFEISAYILYSIEHTYRKKGYDFSFKINNPMIFLVSRDENNDLLNLLKSKYDLVVIDVSNVRYQKIHHMYIKRVLCEKGHSMLTTKEHHPILCPICFSISDKGRIVSYERTMLTVYKLWTESTNFGDVVLYVPKPLYDFILEVGLDFSLICTRLSKSITPPFFGQKIDNAFFAVGVIFRSKLDYNPVVVGTFDTYPTDVKIYHLAGASGIKNMIVALPLVFTLFDNFSILYVNISDRDENAIESAYFGFNRVSTKSESLNKKNIFIRDLQYSNYYIRKAILDLYGKKNIVSTIRLVGQLSLIKTTSPFTIINGFRAYKIHPISAVDFVVFSEPEIIEEGAFYTAFSDYSNYIKRILKIINIDPNIIEQYIRLELNELEKIYPDFANLVESKKKTIYKMSKIFAAINKSMQISINDVRYAIAYFSLIYLLPFVGSGLYVLKVLERYSNELGIFYKKFIGSLPSILYVYTLSDISNIILALLKENKLTMSEIENQISYMISTGKLKYSIEIPVRDSIRMAVSKLLQENKIKEKDGVYYI